MPFVLPSLYNQQEHLLYCISDLLTNSSARCKTFPAHWAYPSRNEKNPYALWKDLPYCWRKRTCEDTDWILLEDFVRVFILKCAFWYCSYMLQLPKVISVLFFVLTCLAFVKSSALKQQLPPSPIANPNSVVSYGNARFTILTEYVIN